MGKPKLFSLGICTFCPTLSTQKVNEQGDFVVPLDLPACCLSGLSCSWLVLLVTCLFTQSVQCIRGKSPLMQVAPRRRRSPRYSPFVLRDEKVRSTEVQGRWGLWHSAGCLTPQLLVAVAD